MTGPTALSAPSVAADTTAVRTDDSDRARRRWPILVPVLAVLAGLAATWAFRSLRRPAETAPVASATARADDGAAGSSGTGAGTAQRKGDGVGYYVRRGERVPVPVGGHLPLDDPEQPPEGYPIKGDAESGLYHTHSMPTFAAATADLWFASASAASSAGFSAADSA